MDINFQYAMYNIYAHTRTHAHTSLYAKILVGCIPQVKGTYLRQAARAI